MISERSIERMFLNSHQLNSIVSRFYDQWKDIFRELAISTCFLQRGGHTYMCFIDQGSSVGRFKFFNLPFIFFFGMPYLGAEYFGFIILYNAVGISRNTFSLASFPVN